MLKVSWNEKVGRSNLEQISRNVKNQFGLRGTCLGGSNRNWGQGSEDRFEDTNWNPPRASMFFHVHS